VFPTKRVRISCFRYAYNFSATKHAPLWLFSRTKHLEYLLAFMSLLLSFLLLKSKKFSTFYLFNAINLHAALNSPLQEFTFFIFVKNLFFFDLCKCSSLGTFHLWSLASMGWVLYCICFCLGLAAERKKKEKRYWIFNF